MPEMTGADSCAPVSLATPFSMIQCRKDSVHGERRKLPLRASSPRIINLRRAVAEGSRDPHARGTSDKPRVDSLSFLVRELIIRTRSHECIREIDRRSVKRIYRISRNTRQGFRTRTRDRSMLRDRDSMRR